MLDSGEFATIAELAERERLTLSFMTRTLRLTLLAPHAVEAILDGGSRTEENCANIISIPGIGPMISTAMVAAIGKGEAFDRGRDFAAWVGLVPTQYSTGGRTVLGGITKRGGWYLSMLLVQAAKVIMMRQHRWADFSFGPWLTRAVARMPRNKAAVALAVKLARTAWSVPTTAAGSMLDKIRLWK